jgi:hypothetical protein
MFLLESKYRQESNIIVKTERGSKIDETITTFETPMGNLKQEHDLSHEEKERDRQ